MRTINGMGVLNKMKRTGGNHVGVTIKKTCENHSVLAGLRVFNYWQLD